MNEKVAKIIDDYSIRNALLDESAIKRIIEIIKNEYQLHNFISDTTFLYNINDGYIAYYENKSLIIKICIDRLRKKVQTECEYLSIVDQNILMARIIFHEIFHALQLKKCYEETGFESDLYNDCFAYFCSLRIVTAFHYDIYTKYHSFFPIERMADIDSSKLCLDISEYLGNEFDFRKQYIKFLTCNYANPTEYYSPLEVYARKTHSNILKRQDFYSKSRNELLCNVQDLYSLEDRLRLGLPISNDEYSLIRRINN